MPKVKITNNKGIVQESGSGLEVSSATTFKNHVQFTDAHSITGHTNPVKVVSTVATPGASDPRIELSGSHSGTTFVLSDDSADYKIVIPKHDGWNARFVVTGSGTTAAVLTNNVFLSASANFAISSDRNPFRGVVLADGGGANSGDITGGTGNANNDGMVKVIGGSGGVDGGDYVDVEVISTTAATATIVISGMTNS